MNLAKKIPQLPPTSISFPKSSFSAVVFPSPIDSPVACSSFLFVVKTFQADQSIQSVRTLHLTSKKDKTMSPTIWCVRHAQVSMLKPTGFCYLSQTFTGPSQPLSRQSRPSRPSSHRPRRRTMQDTLWSLPKPQDHQRHRCFSSPTNLIHGASCLSSRSRGQPAPQSHSSFGTSGNK